LELCIKCAVATLVDRAHQQSGSLLIKHEVFQYDIQYDIAKWFPHLNIVVCKARTA
ncbi:hypothetical protein BDR05DRAFT_1062523, partial [Suillus weaverae]